jgi:hypothetical protein
MIGWQTLSRMCRSKTVEQDALSNRTEYCPAVRPPDSLGYWALYLPGWCERLAVLVSKARMRDEETVSFLYISPGYLWGACGYVTPDSASPPVCALVWNHVGSTSVRCLETSFW